MYLAQSSESRRGIDIVPLAELDEFSSTAREIWGIYRDAIISSLGKSDPVSLAFNGALYAVCTKLRRENRMLATFTRSEARRHRQLEEGDSADSSNDHPEHSESVNNPSEPLDDEEELSIL